MPIANFHNKKILGLRISEIGLLLLFYSFFGLAYHMAIYATSEGKEVFVPNIFVDYGLKALFTLPVWLIIFRVLKNKSIWIKVFTHIILLPLYAYGWRGAYYWCADQFGFFHMDYPYSYWDIYITELFYALQFGIFHVYEFYHKLQAEERNAAELRQLALQSELTALKAQLNPHFLYNIFNAISASVPPKQETTREMIAKLSDLFRYQLKGSQIDLVPLNEEIVFIKKYLELEKERFGNRLNYHIDLDPNAKDFTIPPMILQPLVENAVKHGISSQIEGGEIWIKVGRIGDKLIFEICDSGKGNPEGKDSLEYGVGLSNTIKRLEKMYNSELQFSERVGGGFCVNFEIPIRQESIKKNEAISVPNEK